MAYIQDSQRLLAKINTTAGNCQTITDYMNGLIVPYRYFKKLNILPLNIVEGEMDKHFDIHRNLLADYENLPYYILQFVKLYEFPITKLTLMNYSKYYNNFPLQLITDNCGGERPIKEDIIKNLDKFENVLDKSDYCVWTNRLYNIVEGLYKQNYKNLTHLVNLYNENEKLVEENRNRTKKLEAGMIVMFDNSKFRDIGYHKYRENNNLLITKFCAKTVKVEELRTTKLQDPPKRRQIKLEEFNMLVEKTNPQILTKAEWNSTYGSDFKI